MTAYRCAGGFDCLSQQVCTGNSSCSQGFYCPGYSLSSSPESPLASLLSGELPEQCPAGYYCANPALQPVRCPYGYFCPKESPAPQRCEALSMCPAGSQRQQYFIPIVVVCLAAFFVVIGLYIYRIVRDVRRRDSESKRSWLASGPAKRTDPESPPPQARRSGSERGLHAAQPDPYSERVSLILPSPGSDTSPAPQATAAFGSYGATAGGQRGSSGRVPSGLFPLDVDFENIRSLLPSGQCIVDSASGRVAPGRVTGILGPSGAGKTSLLNVLLGQYPLSDGFLRVNGQNGNLSRFRRLVGFVPQQDVLIPVLTVKETLLHAARTRLPQRTTASEIEQQVTRVLKILGLHHVRHSLVGDPFRRGISGGERKRVNIGIELVADPSLIALDEPTTGLDATVAQGIIECLHSIAATGATVVAVLHQPRFEIFEMLDDILLLGPGGRTVFFGPSSQAIPFFTKLGFAIPRRTNPSDFFLDVLSGRFGEFPLDCLEGWDPAGSYPDRYKNIFKVSSPANPCMSRLDAATRLASRSPPSFLRQFAAFLRRSVIQQYRNPRGLLLGLVLHFLSGLSLGLVFSSARGIFILYEPQISTSEAMKCPYIVRSRCVGEPLEQNALLDFIFFSLIVLSGCGIVAALQTFGEERLFFQRETRADVSISSYFLAKCLVDLPFIVFNSLVFTGFLYFFLYPHGSFRDYYLTLFLADLCAYGAGYIVSETAKKQNAMVIGCVLSVVLSVCSGARPPLKDIKQNPVFLALWSLSFQRWVGELFYIAEAGSYSPQFPVAGGFEVQGYDQGNQATDAWVAVVLAVAMRMVCLTIMKIKYRKNKI